MNKSNLKNASKAYKHMMNFYINKHNEGTQDKLRNLKSKNPRDFWKIMNSLKKQNIMKILTLRLYMISLRC